MVNAKIRYRVNTQGMIVEEVEEQENESTQELEIGIEALTLRGNGTLGQMPNIA